MLSSSVLISFSPPKTFHFDPIHRLPTSKARILIRGSESKRFFGGGVWRVRVSDQEKMTEVVGIDAFRGGNGSEEEGEAILSDGPSGFDRVSELSGFESSLNQMSKWLIAALFGLVILWKHDSEAMWVAMGSVVNSCISVKLKNILNHRRPASALRSDPGMPSSHAQSIFYTALFAILSLFQWLGINTFTVGAGSAILICGSYL
ncbi:lipid phosphate phosphatase epsilon 2, chloroplastic-like isoform X2 [Asparagus officinalis]|nr:lipid phosphate phosphatase epsilon 2, chloroplastic-like isoform X2 [Asparagus officinalis]